MSEMEIVGLFGSGVDCDIALKRSIRQMAEVKRTGKRICWVNGAEIEKAQRISLNPHF